MISFFNFLLIVSLLIRLDRLTINYEYCKLSKSFLRFKIIKISCNYRSCRVVLSLEILDFIITFLMRSMITLISMAKCECGQASCYYG